jgi:hypothetical protein
MEQARELPCDRIDPRQIRALVQIVMMAGESQVGRHRRSFVLARNNVLDLERSDGGMRLGKPAVLAAEAGATADGPAQLWVHHRFLVFPSSRRACYRIVGMCYTGLGDQASAEDAYRHALEMEEDADTSSSSWGGKRRRKSNTLAAVARLPNSNVRLTQIQ